MKRSRFVSWKDHLSTVRRTNQRWDRMKEGKLVAEMVKVCTDKGKGIVTLLRLITNRT